MESEGQPREFLALEIELRIGQKCCAVSEDECHISGTQQAMSRDIEPVVGCCPFVSHMLGSQQVTSRGSESGCHVLVSPIRGC